MAGVFKKLFTYQLFDNRIDSGKIVCKTQPEIILINLKSLSIIKLVELYLLSDIRGSWQSLKMSAKLLLYVTQLWHRIDPSKSALDQLH